MGLAKDLTLEHGVNVLSTMSPKPKIRCVNWLHVPNTC